MKRAVCCVSLMAALLFLVAAVPSSAGANGWRGHGGHRPAWHGHRWHGHPRHGPRIVIGLGSGFWWGARHHWYGPPPVYVYPRPVYVAPPRVIVEERPVFIEREPAGVAPSSYWYYCQSAGGYYPSVPSCPEPWVPVPPRPE